MNSKTYLQNHSGPRLAVVSLLFAVLYVLTCALTSCSTVAGAGQDVQKLGGEIQEAAHDAQ
ncbi:entericidin A/B family lipoprotein [Haloferula sargassicola]